ncbi:cell division protein FtsQ/DivIB [Spongiivirga citrea]|uniref:Cell division protein FtsQ n=1 Tax=Spongiivirga citrea TaxID=1481457 RepID=A0A6M0CK31_9FLAO|nr:cell division protein FtsQ/DivIB [Spongiivirga citrea]NER18296.1 hypothetical protein [Spongiivirga citrea]
MKFNWVNIRIILMVMVVSSLYAFTSIRHDSQKIGDVKVSFDEKHDNLFISETTVNKLLIQNEQGLTSMFKDRLVLGKMEANLIADKMIQNAEVYVSVNGILKAKVEQRTPIARVVENGSYYIDIQGQKMPLSPEYSARVPLISGNILESDIESLYTAAMKVREDDFLKKEVITIDKNALHGFEFRFRTNELRVVFGDTDKLDRKIKNLKAFYKKALKDSMLVTYNKVDLRFENQVVCTKK